MIVPALETVLPVVKKLPECADWSKTVSPFIPQLYALPYQLVEKYNDIDALKHLYLSTNPLISAFFFAAGIVAPIVFIVAEINQNFSQIDRLWSILPPLYTCHYALWAHLSGLPAQRLDHIMAISVLWGIRLTFNYWRKGGYKIGEEDYRWVVVRKYAQTRGWMLLFNLTFISFAQSLLLFLITTPTYILLLCSRITGDELDTYDQVFSKLVFLLIMLEFFADQQQWNFHQAKNYYKKTAKVPKEYKFTREQLDRGFNTVGLFAWSRHPNFAAEQAVWCALYQWCCVESFTFVNWAFLGTFAYLLLFQASTWFTEMITSEKYPEYAVYQKKVGKFLPKGNTKSMEEPKKPVEKKAVEENKKTSKGPAKGKGRKR